MKPETLDRLTKVFSKPNEIVVLAKIMEYAGMIMSFIKQCSSPEAARAQIKQGGPIAYSYARKVVRQTTKLRGREARDKAMELTNTGTQLTDPEFDELIEDAKDAPPVTLRGGIFQLGAMIALALTLAFASTSQAQEKGIFQIDVEQNQRLDQHDAAIARIDAIIDRLRSVRIPEASAAAVAPARALPANAIVSPGVLAIANDPTQRPWVEAATGRTSDAHLVRDHGFTPQQIAGLSQAQKDRLHGYAHEHPHQVAQAVRQTVRQTAPVQAANVFSRTVVRSSGCPNGVCPMRVRRRGR